MRVVLLALLLAGCGRLGFDPTGGGGDDVPADAPEQPGPVSVTLRVDGKPAGNVDVLFHDSSGNFLSSTKSDSLGKVTAALPGGAMVTIVVEQAASIEAGFRVFTIVGVQPNDVIEIGDAVDRWEPLGDVAVTLPGAFAGASKYEVNHGCASTPTTDPLEITTETHAIACSPNNLGAVLARASDGDSTLAYTLMTDIVLVEGTPNSVTLPAWSTTYDTVQVDVRNTPVGAGDVFVGLTALWGTVGFDTHSNSTETITPSVILPVERPTGFSNAQDLVVTAAFDAGHTGVFLRSTGSGTTRMVDLANALPSLKTATITPDASGRARMKATAQGDLAGTDAGLLDVIYPNVFWSFLLPPGTVDFKLPAIPNAFAAIRSNATTVFDPPGLTFIDADYVSGYAAIRVKPHTFNGPEDLPATSSARFTFANYWPFDD